MSDTLDTSEIKDWRSIITLIVFVVTNVIVLFPFRVPLYIPRVVVDAILNGLSALRVISRRQTSGDDKRSAFQRFNFPLNLVTAPLIADLFLLAILAIGREEVYDGTVGADHIFPLDIMAFFITLAYIAISIDSSGLIRWLSFKVLQKGGKSGRLLYLYLYIFFFALATLIGNDPIVLSGTPFLSYMTRASSNIADPKAWIFTQFAISNVASAVLVTSNPTNLVLAGAFEIKFVEYTANIIVPVVVTAVLLFPFLLFVWFRSESLIPSSIKQHTLPEESKAKTPTNPNIPYSQGVAEKDADDEQTQLLLLEEIMNPFLDKVSAAVGATIMVATLITILVVNASSQNSNSVPAYWVTCPAAFAMLCWDLTYGWIHRHESRSIARQGREQLELNLIERPGVAIDDELGPGTTVYNEDALYEAYGGQKPISESSLGVGGKDQKADGGPTQANHATQEEKQIFSPTSGDTSCDEIADTAPAADNERSRESSPSQPEYSRPSHADNVDSHTKQNANGHLSDQITSEKTPSSSRQVLGASRQKPERTTLVSLAKTTWAWARETFPTVTTVASLLPFKLVPFALTMFVLVQALVTKGWVAVFAYGWEHWINATGTVGAIVGMGFLSVVLCNFAGTNIGTTILLCRVVQAWEVIHRRNGLPISQRTFWATVYSMAIGLNYGAFSTAFSASLAGLLWRDILARKKIFVRARDFVLVNLPIIAVAMIVGSLVLIGEVYIARKTTAYDLG